MLGNFPCCMLSNYSAATILFACSVSPGPENGPLMDEIFTNKQFIPCTRLIHFVNNFNRSSPLLSVLSHFFAVGPRSRGTPRTTTPFPSATHRPSTKPGRCVKHKRVVNLRTQGILMEVRAFKLSLEALSQKLKVPVNLVVLRSQGMREISPQSPRRSPKAPSGSSETTMIRPPLAARRRSWEEV